MVKTAVNESLGKPQQKIDVEKISRDLQEAAWLIRALIEDMRSQAADWTGGEAIVLAALEKAGAIVDRADGMLINSEPSCVGTFENWADWSRTDDKIRSEKAALAAAPLASRN